MTHLARDAGILLVEMAVLFAIVTYGVELARQRLGPDRIRRFLEGAPPVAALKGIGLGFITPFCTYTALPVWAGMRSAGVGSAGLAAFIVAAPILDPVLLTAIAVVVGPITAGVYTLVAFVAAVGVALLAHRFHLERYLIPLTGAGEEATRVGEIPGWGAASRTALAEARKVLRTMAWPMVIGVVIGLAITALVPPEQVAGWGLTSGVAAIPVAALLGTPMYIGTEMFVPLGLALTAAGVGAGPIVAFTIAGTGGNVPEFLMLGRMAGRRPAIALAVYVFSIAILGGLLTTWLTL